MIRASLPTTPYGDSLNTRMTRALALVVTTLFFTGCYTVAVEYHPTASLADAASAPSVRVEIVDARPEDQGLHDETLIGQYRGSFGIPSGVDNGTDGVMPATVSAVTIDALASAGVGVNPAADDVLVCTVTQYWADGFGGLGAWVTVEYALAGTAWQSTVEGSAGGSAFWSKPERVVEELIEESLVDLAAQAGEAFSEASFDAALAE